MPIWSTASVAEEPVIQLSRWGVARLYQHDSHVDIAFGYRDQARSGRISSPILGIENGTGRLITLSGRRYVLLGDPGIDADGLYVLRMSLRASDTTAEEDVSAAYWSAMMLARMTAQGSLS
jgi:hypothetical protein